MKTSVLCSVHFAPDSFCRKISIRDQPSVRRLEKGAFPTIDVAVRQENRDFKIPGRLTSRTIILGAEDWAETDVKFLALFVNHGIF